MGLCMRKQILELGSGTDARTLPDTKKLLFVGIQMLKWSSVKMMQKGKRCDKMMTCWTKTITGKQS